MAKKQKAPKDRADKQRGVKKWSPQTRAKILGSVREGVFLYNAAAIAGIGESTLRRWIAKGREELQAWEEWSEAVDDGEGSGEPEPRITAWGTFALAVAEAEGTAEATAIRRIVSAGLEDWRAAAWYLERKNARRYGSFATRVDLQSETSAEADQTMDAEAMFLESVEIIKKRVVRAGG